MIQPWFSMVQAGLNTLEIFDSISGKKVNTEKTHIAWIGKKKHSKDKIICKNKVWILSLSLNLLGIYLFVELDKCLEGNYTMKMFEIREVLTNRTKGI